MNRYCAPLHRDWMPLVDWNTIGIAGNLIFTWIIIIIIIDVSKVMISRRVTFDSFFSTAVSMFPQRSIRFDRILYPSNENEWINECFTISIMNTLSNELWKAWPVPFFGQSWCVCVCRIISHYWLSSSSSSSSAASSSYFFFLIFVFYS